MTMGARIQELRRQEGLSQEALGEALGVSRQAISKWESDTTIPEVDKLVALSRLFGVSVGALLGVEEEPEPGETEPGPGAEKRAPEELTDRELRAIEDIVGRYLAELEARRPRPFRKKWPWVLGGVAAGFVLLCAVQLLLGTVSRVEEQVTEVQSQVVRFQSDVTGQISSITSRVEDALAEQENLLAGSGWAVEAIDPEAGTARLEVSAVPKTYADGMTATFLLRSGTETLATAAAEADGESLSFCAEGWEVPLADYLELWVAFGDGGESRSQRLDTIYNLTWDTAIHLTAQRNTSDQVSGAVVGLVGVGALADAWPVSLEVRCGEEVAPVNLTGPWEGEPYPGQNAAAAVPAMPEGDAPDELADWRGTSITYYPRFEGGVPEGTITVTLTDSEGRTYVEEI